MQGSVAPQRFDVELLDCEVEGTIPSDMSGAFVRVGAEWYYPPKFADDAFLHADGYVSAFRFKDGKVGYRGKFVRTPRFLSNLAAGRQQFGLYRNPFTSDETVRDLDATVSNTAPLCHAGKLFTLKEDALPYQIDAETLDTIGPWDFGGAYKSQTFTAHPKVDPLSGELIAFGYEATGLASDDVFLYVIDRRGTVSRELRLKVPYVSLMHDFAVTQEHVIFPFACYTTSMERLKAGQIHWGWDRTKPSMIGILRRDGDGSDLRWFKGPERCMMHLFNAYSEGDKVVLYAPFYEFQLLSLLSQRRRFAVGSDPGRGLCSQADVRFDEAGGHMGRGSTLPDADRGFGQGRSALHDPTAALRLHQLYRS